MNEQQENRQLCPPHEKIQLGRPIGRNTRHFLTFLVCCSILVAAFAVSGTWMRGKTEDALGNGKEDPQQTTEPSGSNALPSPNPETPPVEIPQGAIAVISKDLSLLSAGEHYIQNESIHSPALSVFRQFEANAEDLLLPAGEPLVLILHTHATEAYLPSGTAYLQGPLGDATYSEDPEEGVIAAGEALYRSLANNGITALHCKQIHGENGSLQHSYAAAADCIERYLKQYPSIRYVIDLHRDAILDAEGNYIRTEAEGENIPTAQVLPVVGSDGNGTQHPNWQKNLSLALALRKELNETTPSICRPVMLKNASYNQELAPYSLLLEIGSGGNSVEEAERAAALVGDALAALLKK